jgi:hypothetical protein
MFSPSRSTRRTTRAPTSRMDAELIAWNESPDPGAAPGIPAGRRGRQRNRDVSDGLLDARRRTRSSSGSSESARATSRGRSVESEYPGSFDSYVDSGLDSSVAYDYRLSAVNLHGHSANSAVASGTTIGSFIPTIFEENFNVVNSLGKFTFVDVLEPDSIWRYVLWDFGSTGAAQGNNFGAGNTPTEDWLITTNPINFLFHQDEILEYDSQISFSGPSPQVLVSTDYDPPSTRIPTPRPGTVVHTDTSATATLTKVGPFPLDTVDARGYPRLQVHRQRRWRRPEQARHDRRRAREGPVRLRLRGRRRCLDRERSGEPLDGRQRELGPRMELRHGRAAAGRGEQQLRIGGGWNERRDGSGRLADQPRALRRGSEHGGAVRLLRALR